MTDDPIKPVEMVKKYDAQQEIAPALAEALKMFSDDLPFSEGRSWAKIDFWQKFETVARFEIGKELILIHEHLKTEDTCKDIEISPPGGLSLDNLQEIGLTLKERFARRIKERSRISLQSAYEYMVFARKAAQSPKLQALAQGKNWKMAYVLCQELNEEEIKYLDETGDVRGLNNRQIEGMKPEEIRKALKKAKTENEELAQENSGLKEKVQDLEEQLEQAPGEADKAMVLVKSADKKVLEAGKMLGNISDTMFRQNRNLVHLVLGVCDMAMRVLTDLQNRAFEANAYWEHLKDQEESE